MSCNVLIQKKRNLNIKYILNLIFNESNLLEKSIYFWEILIILRKRKIFLKSKLILTNNLLSILKCFSYFNLFLFLRLKNHKNKQNLFITKTKKCALYLLMVYKLNSGLIGNFFNQETVQSLTNCWFLNKYFKQRTNEMKLNLSLFEFQIKIFISIYPFSEIKSYQQNIFLFEYFSATFNQIKNQGTMDYLYRNLIFKIIESKKFSISSNYIIRTKEFTRLWLKNYQKNTRCFLFRFYLYNIDKQKNKKYIFNIFNIFFKIKKIWKKKRKQKNGQKFFIDLFRNF
jgi:hypothetical protein